MIYSIFSANRKTLKQPFYAVAIVRGREGDKREYLVYATREDRAEAIEWLLNGLVIGRSGLYCINVYPKTKEAARGLE